MNVTDNTNQRAGFPYSRIGVGLAALGRPGYMTLGHANDLPASKSREDMLHHALLVLDAAWSAGVRYFDVARSYGEGELFLNTWLRTRNIPVEQTGVGSKWGYTYTANWQVHASQHEVKDHSLATLRRQVGESSNLLSPWLKLYQIHSATMESGVLQNDDVLDELARLRDGGLTIGLSLSGKCQAEVLEKALAVRRAGMPLFSSVQATWNLLERSVGPMLHVAHEAGWLIIAKEALANGRLTSREQTPASAIGLLSKKTQHNIDTLAIAAALAQPWADIVLSGAATVQHLQSNLAAGQVKWNNAWDTMLASLQEEPEVYWRKRSQLSWN